MSVFNNVAQAMQSIFGEHQLARETGFIKRERKGSGFIKTLCLDAKQIVLKVLPVQDLRINYTYLPKD